MRGSLGGGAGGMSLGSAGGAAGHNGVGACRAERHRDPCPRRRGQGGGSTGGLLVRPDDAGGTYGPGPHRLPGRRRAARCGCARDEPRAVTGDGDAGPAVGPGAQSRVGRPGHRLVVGVDRTAPGRLQRQSLPPPNFGAAPGSLNGKCWNRGDDSWAATGVMPAALRASSGAAQGADNVEAVAAGTSTAPDPSSQELGDEDGGARKPRANQETWPRASSSSLATFGDEVVALISVAGGCECVFLTFTGARGWAADAFRLGCVQFATEVMGEGCPARTFGGAGWTDWVGWVTA